MGVVRFLVEPESMLEEWPELEQAYISGFDGRIYPTRVEVAGNVICCRRQSSDSGKLHVAWPVPGFGRPIMTTSSLREQEAPYNLAVELARGKICQVRNQVAHWEAAGMRIPPEFYPPHRKAHKLFADAASNQESPKTASETATQAISQACDAAEIVTKAYIRQRLTVRRHRSKQFPVSLACNLGTATPVDEWGQLICPAFNAAGIPLEWKVVEPREGEYDWDTYDKQIDWCLKNRLIVRGGPLLSLAPDGLPGWLEQWSHDFFNLQSFLCDFVETAISRYVGKIRMWEVSSCVNTGGGLNLSEENRLTLVARTLEVARQVDQEAELLIQIDQPWGEYQVRGEHRLSPTQFVDALLRCGVGLSGVNLEVSVGYSPRGSASRDILEWSRMIDQWSSLEIPLHVTLAFPSSGDHDNKANSNLKIDSTGWKNGFSAETQAHWIEQYLPVLMAKESVVGICWTHLSDADLHDFPNAGLLDHTGKPKLALNQFVQARNAHWK
jgi:GH35 family endo-1,4-beta-xylanase